MGDEGLRAALGAALGGEVGPLRRLSGGASRVTSAFELTRGTTELELILQQHRGEPSPFALGAATEARLLAGAARAGVPVAPVIGVGEFEGHGWLVVKRLAGETIPRRILRDEEFAVARAAFARQCGAALAAIHSLDPNELEGLPRADRLRDPLTIADALQLRRPVIELGSRWLERHRPPVAAPTTVHGDFRMGNLLIDQNGLCAVLDWELAHEGDPAEDLGWLCHRTWRFAGPGRVGGVGDLADLLESYVAHGGRAIEESRVVWWEVYAAVKWGVICAMQSAAHLTGMHRSVELATIGRRVAESEWDLLVRLDLCDALDPVPTPSAISPSPLARPRAVELVEAVREYLDTVVEGTTARFQDRVARNALAIAERELQRGDAVVATHRDRLRTLGFASDDELCDALRSGRLDQQLEHVGRVLASSIRDELLIANPRHLDEPTPS